MKNRNRALTGEEQKLFNLLEEKYGVLPNAAQTAEIVKKSKATLYRERKAGTGIRYIQDSDHSMVRYPLHEIVRYLCNTHGKGVENEL